MRHKCDPRRRVGATLMTCNAQSKVISRLLIIIPRISLIAMQIVHLSSLESRPENEMARTETDRYSI